MAKDFRIVSLCPSNTELVFALGLGDYLVGVDNYSDYPADKLQHLPRLGPDLHIDIHLVEQLAPDLVLSSLSVPGMERVVDGIQSTGLRQIVCNAHNLSGVYEELEVIADAIPRAILDRAVVQRVLQGLKARVSRIQEWTQVHPTALRIYWEWWAKPVFSPAKENWLTEITHLAGAENIFATEPGQQVQDDGTRVCEGQPDMMFAVWTGIAQDKVPLAKIINRADSWRRTPAFQNRQIYVLSEGLYCRPGPRLVDGLEQLVGLLHPRFAEEQQLQPPYKYAPIRHISGEWVGGRQP
ncbi:ABC transporter substrate-binding protein [Alicyclobacillus fastidiosus]|uniref:ABC transporter substrate-binding protein n=1 Tax=Alicyclobacillus fastidiosus TaxID=392011 RepID=A0ABY6ZGZ9_9BACL|nr:ABC transporter substrate-binding protein [Alicyclobacillus fastidiosus]WAH42117.1 ABC transporter substrate-binding protein [Alicyclobacillus fastidiosus]GMA63895.1 cobalamin-binding protein [Alicyclobacillus fastidiosus]